MPYDFNESHDRDPPTEMTRHLPDQFPANDDAAIMMALEIAALCLTPRSWTEFTLDQLLDEVCAMGCDDRAAVAEVAGKVPFLEKRGDRLRLV